MFATKETRSVRQNRRLFLLLTGVVTLIAIYLALPLIIAEYLQYRLTLAGFTQVDVSSGRPSWNELRLDAIQLSRRSGNRIFTAGAKDVTICYRPLELLSGHFASIQIPKTVIESGFIENEMPAQSDAVENFRPIALSAFAPGQWLSRLPTDELSLDDLNLHLRIPNGGQYTLHAAGHIRDGQGILTGEIRPTEGQLFTFSARAAVNGEFSLDVRASGTPAPPILHIATHAGEIKDRHLNVDGLAQASLDGIELLLRPWFGSGEKPPLLHGSLESRWQGTVPAANGTWEGVKISSDHSLKIKAEQLGDAFRSAEARIDATARLEGNQIRWQLGNESTLVARLSVRANTQAEPQVAMTFPKGLAGQVELAPERMMLSLTAGLPVHLAPVDWKGFSSSVIHIELADAAKLRYDLKPGRWAWEPFALSTKPISLDSPDGAIQTDAITFEIDELSGGDTEWQGKGELRVANLKPKIQGKPLPTGDVLIKFQGDSKRLDVESTMTVSQGKLVLNGQARHEFASGKGAAQFELAPVVFGESGFKLSQLLESWPYPVDLHAGRINAVGGSSWSRSASHGAPEALRLENEVTVNVEGLAGRFKTIRFDQLDAHLALSDQGGLRTIDPVRLKVAQLDLGIPITELNAEAAVTHHPQSGGPIIDVRQFGANLLGGTVHSSPFLWDTAHPSHPVVLVLQGLSLSQIIALERQQGVEGSGLLDGRLPLEITKTHVALRGGELHARPPGGWIRYRPTEEVRAMAKGNLSLEFVYQALSNLQYKTLKVNADSTPKGDMTLRVELRGHNPDWQSGRPIHLNLNLRENILMLLRSLRVADELTDRMNRQIQEHYRKKH
ncbi:YdbH domain-containing protein [Methylocaldum sp.]|uniref:YdbH domain-containing protein n=1 Tax=Methylocaldum sp. TaxID=1969727 RepID=UPI002D38BD71|nr:YdbH domain-containing protein [Methylocaldum sp.]HYE37844.1 YdbH domain-containing protein [Methylocaldum sp.]